MEALRIWANGSKLLVAAFYFWYQGTDMQKSKLCLLRGLLHYLLESDPTLVGFAFPDWHNHKSRLELTLEDVLPACHRMHQDVETSGRKVCLLIDGLDEFEGDSMSMSALAVFVRNIRYANNVKVLASSRLLQPFEDAFRQSSRLTLHDLTYGNISRLATESLGKHPWMAYLLSTYPEEATQLMEDTSSQSCGVSLWVVLATRAI